MSQSTIQFIQDSVSQGEAIAELSLVLEKIIRQLISESPQSITVFVDGTEVYRQQAETGQVLWWGTDNSLNAPKTHSMTFVSPQ